LTVIQRGKVRLWNFGEAQQNDIKKYFLADMPAIAFAFTGGNIDDTFSIKVEIAMDDFL